jgi:hypothetical protein
VIPHDDGNDGIAENGFIIVGSTNINSTNSDVWIICIDNNKNYLRDEYYGGSLNDIAYSVIQFS